MPIISMFFGIAIKVFYREHNPPHFHAYYQGFEALFNINTGELMEGKFPPKACKIIKEWSLEYQRELLEVWDLAQKGKQLFRIPGADQ
ncbi:MAG: DUF4160 domain-containing protein [Bacteriovoracaceae bacterium]